MADVTDTERTDIVEDRFRTDPRWLALFTDSAMFTEVTDSGYSRRLLSFGPGTQAATNSDVDFGVAGVAYNVGSIGIFDNSSDGDMRYSHTLSTPVTVLPGQYFTYPAGKLIVTFD